MEFIYKALRGTLEHTSVTEDEVDRQLTRLQQQTPRMTQVTDRAAKSGDEVILDYAGYCGGGSRRRGGHGSSAAYRCNRPRLPHRRGRSYSYRRTSLRTWDI